MSFSVLLGCCAVVMLFLFMGGCSSVFDTLLWESGSSVVNFSFFFDGVSTSFSFVVCVISCAVFCFAVPYMADDHYIFRFFWLLLFFVVSMNVLVFSGSFFSMMVGWDGLGVTSFVLIIYYQSESSLMAGFATMVVNRAGDVMLMCSSVFFVGGFGYYHLVGGLVLMLVGGMTKSAQYPFSMWLPAAMAAPTPVSALVHSSTLVTAGVFLLFRVGGGSLEILVFFGGVTSLVGGLCAFFENDLKKVIAYSTLSHLGIMMFSLGLGCSELALFHLYTHAFFKASLFLAGGCTILTSFGSQDLRDIKTPALVAAVAGLSCLCMMGVPFLSAFYSKHIIMMVVLSSAGSAFGVMFMLGSLFVSSAYSARIIKSLFSSVPCISQLPSGLTFPLLSLCPMAVASGSVFKSLLGVNMAVSTPFDYVLSLVSVFGLIWGWMVVPAESILVTSMFFMAPVFYGSPALLIPIFKGLSSLDSGWLEPLFFDGWVLALDFWSKYGFYPHCM